MMKKKSVNPRVLVVTPEVSYLPQGMDNSAQCRNARAGGLGDVSAALINDLYRQGADVHLAIPDYRTIFNSHMPLYIRNKIRLIRQNLPYEKIHLAQDRAFYYLNRVYSGSQEENINISLAFQREVMNNIVPRVQPDLIHCNDWMTGLIPAMAREMEIPCLFSIHNIHSVKIPLSHIEDMGIDGASFWHHLFFDQYPGSYEDARNRIPVDFLVSGVFAAHFVNTVSPTFLNEIIGGYHDFVSPDLRRELAIKKTPCAPWVSSMHRTPPLIRPPMMACFAGILLSTMSSGKPPTNAIFKKSWGLRRMPMRRCFSGPPGWIRSRRDVNCCRTSFIRWFPNTGKRTWNLFLLQMVPFRSILKKLSAFMDCSTGWLSLISMNNYPDWHTGLRILSSCPPVLNPAACLR